jgi:hypothetical protein
MKRFTEIIKPQPVLIEKFISIEEQAKMNIGSRFKQAAAAGILGGLALAGSSVLTRPQITNPMEKESVPFIPHPGVSQPTSAPPPASVPQTPATTPSEQPQSVFSNPQHEKFYNAVVQAEHRGRKAAKMALENPNQHHEDLYIRTYGKNSTAYGPAQITLGTAKDYFERHPKHFEGNEEYVKNFIDQGEQFKKHLKNPEHPIYGRGGKGVLHGEEHHENYMRMVDGILKGMSKDMKMKPDQFNHTAMTTRWRGVPKDNDKIYHEIVDKHYTKED